MPSSGFQKCRSEEHTSELQSHDNLVCRLLLEKKNNTAVRISHELASRHHPLALSPPRAPRMRTCVQACAARLLRVTWGPPPGLFFFLKIRPPPNSPPFPPPTPLPP